MSPKIGKKLLRFRGMRSQFMAASRCLPYIFKKKILYLITPHPQLANIGDHAQAVAIRRWFAKNFPGVPVIELDKSECRSVALSMLRFLTSSRDLIFLHSGGNLGDRGKLSESRRRAIVQKFRNNQIISLPQTIFFSDTDTGRKEREISKSIYNKHRNLTVIGRDQDSFKLAESLFPNCDSFAIPDFVLSLVGAEFVPKAVGGKKIMLCLRNDNESILSSEDKESLAGLFDQNVDRFDTTLPEPIAKESREDTLRRTLERFGECGAVVTDRFHGVIFGVILGLPIVVLRTVDHKLVSAVEWFKDMPQIRFCDGLDNVPRELRLAREAVKSQVDWNSLYFDRLAERLSLK